MTDDTAALYMQNALDILFNLFLQDFKTVPSSVKEIILDVINEFMDAAPDEFKKYAEKYFIQSSIVGSDYPQKIIGGLDNMIYFKNSQMEFYLKKSYNKRKKIFIILLNIKFQFQIIL